MVPNPLRVYLGWDRREARAYGVAERSIRESTRDPLEIHPIWLSQLKLMQWYWRPIEWRQGVAWDTRSAAPMSTEHAIARFFVPALANYAGWVLAADGDILCRHDLADLFAYADDRYALLVVQRGTLEGTGTKKAGHPQTEYPRKNWSSVVLWNCEHAAHRALTLEVLNTWPGRDLHAFRWLDDAQIGALPGAWNHLVGIDPPDPDARLAHFTLGTPDVDGYADSEFADEWRAVDARVRGEVHA
jgi:hypothetical protein